MDIIYKLFGKNEVKKNKKQDSKFLTLPEDTLIHILSFLDTNFILKSWCLISKERQKDIKYVNRIQCDLDYKSLIKFLSKNSLKIEHLNLVTTKCRPKDQIKNPYCLIQSERDRNREFSYLSGFKCSNDLSKENISSILKDQKFLKSLNVFGCAYFDDELLKSVLNSPLEYLDIMNTSVSHEGLKEIFTKTNIKHLSFGFQFHEGVMCGYPYRPFIEDLFDYDISETFSKSLESLKLSWYFSGKNLEKFFGNFYSLKRITVKNMSISSKTLEIISKNCPNIEYLAFKNIKINTNFSNFKNLKTLKLRNASNDTLKNEIKNIQSLHLYDLSNNDYSFLSELKNLSKLKLKACDIKNETFKTYQSTFQQLKVLILDLNVNLDETLDWKAIIPSKSYNNDKIKEFTKDFKEYQESIYQHNGYTLCFTFGDPDNW